MNTPNCFARMGLGLLLLLPTMAGNAQGVGGASTNNSREAEASSSYPALNWYFQGMKLGGGSGTGLQATLMKAGRLKYLSAPVDVRLEKATVAQAVSALDKASASAMSVLVADNVGDTGKRLTIDARNVPLGTVLEAIAQQTDLMIAPNDTVGVMLKPWPTININGQKSSYHGRNAPWSDEWDTQFSSLPLQQRAAGTLSGSAPGSGQSGETSGPLFSGFGGFGGGQGSAPGGNVPLPKGSGAVRNGTIPPGPGIASGTYGPGGENSGYRGLFQSGVRVPGVGMTSSAAPLSMTVSGDRLVVAELATGPKGEPGYQLTVYSIAGSQMRVMSNAFHASARNIRSLPGSYGGSGFRPGGGGAGMAPRAAGGEFGGAGVDSNFGGVGDTGGLGGKVKPADRAKGDKTDK